MRRPYMYISGYPYPLPPPPPTYPLGYPYSPLNYYHTIPESPPHNIPSNTNSYSYGSDPSQYNRKRQRRQAAAVVVESLWNNNTAGRKSTAQPRPVLTIPPRGIGPIVEPNENDVLCGRGGRINSHAGNVQFRDVINARKKEYLAPTTKKLEKAHIAASIVNDIRAMEPPGRFLKEDRDTGLWFDIGDAKAIKKTGQALREDAPDIRNEIEGDSSGDEKADTPKKSQSEEKKEPTEKEEGKQKPAPKTKPAGASRKPQAQESKRVSEQAYRQVPIPWPQGVVPSVMTAQEYQAQVSMPPPYSHQVNPYMQQQQQQQPTVNSGYFPIQSPLPQSVYSQPSRFASGGKNIGRRVGNASRHAMDALSQSGGQSGDQNPGDLPPDNVAFGRPFYPPANTVLSSDNTMSTISGISDPISSTLGSAIMSDLARGSVISGLSAPSGFSGMDTSAMSPRGSARGPFRENSLRLSQAGLGSSGMGQSSRSHFLESMRSSKMSDMTISARSVGSFGRSLSFNDMNSIADDGTWRTIMEDEEMFNGSQVAGNSLLSGEAPALENPGMYRGSSAMSVTSLSTASSARWLAGLKDTTMGDDGRSVLSEMSSDLHALDLARHTEAR